MVRMVLDGVAWPWSRTGIPGMRPHGGAKQVQGPCVCAKNIVLLAGTL